MYLQDVVSYILLNYIVKLMKCTYSLASSPAPPSLSVLYAESGRVWEIKSREKHHG